VLANELRYPPLNDARANTPFAGIHKVWVMDTVTAETMRSFQVDGLSHWNLHTCFLAGSEEGGHALVQPGGGLL
jgi:hypothetical protein